MRDAQAETHPENLPAPAAPEGTETRSEDLPQPDGRAGETDHPEP